MTNRLNDLSGEKFGFLSVIKRDITAKSVHHTYWVCKCKCGNKKSIRRDALIKGKTVSCGCYKRKISTKHGGYQTRLYNIWQAMKKRCSSNKKHNDKWESYGGRGITIHEDWINSFEIFREWAIASGYEDGLSIERMDVDGNYEPSNCTWANAKEQALNRRNNRLVTIDGRTQSITQWADELGINRATVNSRVNILGWNEIEALTTKVRKKSDAK